MPMTTTGAYSDISIQYVGTNDVGSTSFIETARISESEVLTN